MNHGKTIGRGLLILTAVLVAAALAGCAPGADTGALSEAEREEPVRANPLHVAHGMMKQITIS